ncbi:helix-turn-helix domain-containing protein [Nocardia brasiliensis]|uniref:helix-turn-helix domain-containing protein n=1 Tax=Nocardia brasiliensis TaxID=37326 RepID=UPI0004A718C9|nr:helix-turn-helix transcriptional regulator [Nocardia brasiliensis]
MSAKLDYRWHLRELMARHQMFQTTQLRPKLAERGIELSDSQVYRLVVDKPERLSVKTLVALVDILGCSMEELIEPVAMAPRRRAVVGQAGEDGGVGEFRPKRARVVREQR